MIPLNRASFGKAHELYFREDFFFPLIAAVLLDMQDGVVFADDASNPDQVYVEHAFGFAQLFGTANPNFENDLERYLLADKHFSAPKVRLYAPRVPGFLGNESCAHLQSLRQRFSPSSESLALGIPKNTPQGVTITDVCAENIDAIQNHFGVVNRFWRSADDFINGSCATLILQDGLPAALCYAAAVADGKAEIDVVSLPQFRNRGLGKLAVVGFIHRCRKRNILPLWDCFTNNTGSMALCQAVRFRASGRPYPFYTINKHA